MRDADAASDEGVENAFARTRTLGLGVNVEESKLIIDKELAIRDIDFLTEYLQATKVELMGLKEVEQAA